MSTLQVRVRVDRCTPTLLDPIAAEGALRLRYVDPEAVGLPLITFVPEGFEAFLARACPST